MDDGFRLSQQHAHFPEMILVTRQFPQKLVNALKGAGVGGRGTGSLSITVIRSVWFFPSLSHCPVHMCGLFKSCKETGSPVTRASQPQNKGRGLLTSGGCSLPLLKGRSKKGLHLDKISMRCERFQSFLCMNKSSGKHLLTDWLTGRRGEVSAETHLSGCSRRKHDSLLSSLR